MCEVAQLVPEVKCEQLLLYNRTLLCQHGAS